MPWCAKQRKGEHEKEGSVQEHQRAETDKVIRVEDRDRVSVEATAMAIEHILA